MKKMKLVKMFGVLLCMAIAVCCVLTGCGEDDDKEYLSSADKIVDCFFEGSKDEHSYMWDSLDDLNDKFDDMFTGEKADKVTDDIYTYSVKNVSKLFNERVDLGGTYDVAVKFEMREIKNKMCLSKVTYLIKNVKDADALEKQLSKDIEKTRKSGESYYRSINVYADNSEDQVKISFSEEY